MLSFVHRGFCRVISNNSPNISRIMSYVAEERGRPNTLDYRIYYKNSEGQYISPLHDIPWLVSESPRVYNMVCEVPRWTNSKMEIATKESLNPIKQDVKKGKLRYVANCFPHRGYIWNYGAIPQTWENPGHKDKNTGQCGDNDPIDVCEIGSKICKRGEVIQVKVVGVLAMIDEGETDWKVIGINVNDEDAPKINSIGDVEKMKPGYLDATREWFKIYKIPDGKPANCFAFNGDYKDREFAEETIAETHRFWVESHSGTLKCDFAMENICCSDSKFKIDGEATTKILEAAPALGESEEVTDEKAEKWYYTSLLQGQL
uniref:inorganic pyrophosphatase-like n=1 Tax=Styela clava TaxID=7725 RepID=UPI00193A9067|nr:inorganic pyrophosphatase-like [Styela clava]